MVEERKRKREQKPTILVRVHELNALSEDEDEALQRWTHQYVLPFWVYPLQEED